MKDPGDGDSREPEYQLGVPRKVIQLEFCSIEGLTPMLWALCDDGTLWGSYMGPQGSDGWDHYTGPPEFGFPDEDPVEEKGDPYIEEVEEGVKTRVPHCEKCNSNANTHLDHAALEVDPLPVELQSGQTPFFCDYCQRGWFGEWVNITDMEKEISNGTY